MAKKSLLLVDADPRSLRVLEVSLRKAGYSVATCRDANSALETVDLSLPDLILSDTRLPGMNGFELVEELRRKEELNGVPFMFLSSEASVESKVRGLELGVEDYLTKPIYIKEIITRINLTLQRQEREGLARRTSVAKTRFTGTLGDMGLVDLLQTIDISRKSGVLELSNADSVGTISFRDGQLVDAELGQLVAESAIYRLLLWNEGDFEIDFRPVRVEQRIRASTQAILMEGMRRIDEWGRLLEQIPSLDNVFEVSEEELVERLAEIPDEINGILKYIDGRRSLVQILDAVAEDDLETLTAITKLYFEGIIYPTGRTAGPADEMLDEQLVPGESDDPSEPPAAGPEQSSSEVVPRAQTLPPPGLPEPEERANANDDGAEDGTPVPDDAAEETPETPDPEAIAEPEADPEPGTASATESAEEAESATETAESTTDDPAEALDGEDVEAEGPSDSPEDDLEEEDSMARKGRRRRRRRAKSQSPEAQQAQEQEQEATNVIQFPAQARAAVGSDVVVGDSVSEEAEEVETARADETRTVPREADAPAEASVEEPEEVEEPEAEAKAEAKAEEPAAEEPATEEPAEEAKAEPAEEPEAEAKADEAAEAPAEEPAEEAKAEPAEEPAEAKTEAPAEPEPEPEAKAEPEPKQEKGRRRKGKKGKKRRRRDKKAAAAEAKSVPPAEEPKKAEEKADDIEIAPAIEPAAAKADKGKRRKKNITTSSAEIRAVGGTGEHAVVAEDFFRSSKKPPPVEHETWDDLEKDPVPMAPGMKQAKYATIGILAAGLVLIGGFLFYQTQIMPQPHERLAEPGQAELDDFQPASGDETTTTDEGEGETEPVAAVEPEGEGEGEAVEGEGEAVEGEGEGEAVEGEGELVAEGEGEGEAIEGEGEAVEGEGEAVEGEGETVAAAEPTTTETETEAAAPTAADPQASARFSRQAMAALNRRQHQRAADLAQQSVDADITNAMGWLVLGFARGELNDAAGSRAAYQSCIEHGTNRQNVRECRLALR